MDYGDIKARAAANPALYTSHWDNVSDTPYYTYSASENPDEKAQIWFEDAHSLSRKYALVKELGLRGGGMWHADTLAYEEDAKSKQIWNSLEAMY